MSDIRDQISAAVIPSILANIRMAAPPGPLPSFFAAEQPRMIAHTSEGLAEALHEEIKRHLAECGPEEEVGVAVTAFGHSALLHIESIRASSMNLLVLEGRIDGSTDRASICLHQSQLNVMLLKVRALKANHPIRQIGFVRDVP